MDADVARVEQLLIACHEVSLVHACAMRTITHTITYMGWHCAFAFIALKCCFLTHGLCSRQ